MIGRRARSRADLALTISVGLAAADSGLRLRGTGHASATAGGLAPIVGELSGLFRPLFLPLTSGRMVLFLHVAGPCVGLGAEECGPVLVAIDLAVIHLAGNRARSSAVPTVWVGDMGDRLGAVAAWIVSIEPGVVVALAAAIVVAANAGVVEPLVAAGVYERGAAAGDSVGVRIASGISTIVSIVARVVAGSQCPCAQGGEGEPVKRFHHAKSDGPSTTVIQSSSGVILSPNVSFPARGR